MVASPKRTPLKPSEIVDADLLISEAVAVAHFICAANSDNPRPPAIPLLTDGNLSKLISDMRARVAAAATGTPKISQFLDLIDSVNRPASFSCDDMLYAQAIHSLRYNACHRELMGWNVAPASRVECPQPTWLTQEFGDLGWKTRLDHTTP